MKKNTKIKNISQKILKALQKMKNILKIALRPTPFYYFQKYSTIWFMALKKTIIWAVQIWKTVHVIYVDVWTWYLIYNEYYFEKCYFKVAWEDRKQVLNPPNYGSLVYCHIFLEKCFTT